ncbi:polysaccharide biosynthesis tyrosine autokinase [Mucilaginibacter rubeus]|uniref:Polysaccharide biosynthesis tyrosine autokinase n=1 Tax=Mucilaginibacter rubeus TaxID=2027860 RepID=A0AAE6JCY4_9SPHI|nr:MULTISPECIES: tyrosine-protein kinase [Mucilaginibacter]QEM02522.1 polysaccharide biosynthesis tyrosine autokinase [Mucilaginibacter rubeus]QEM15142.1 polysaccharide biosynthesis tyrosine autokinase [Mucilaginibacter gossypii]QTE42135.1 polysaccharide biosynthesis tyrosine autokinase [Mucilaginibacter rubeus]QTE48736.1 polysaccharide biosynthesis tyrosine autokinase [Mucilaginibacter rubeus]QTE53834.1 polysaccharide biosynthesis tyrosine autokinase [Mucilaginibacter rubeus]
MSTNQTQFLTFATEKEKNSSVSLKSLFAKYLYNWRVIVVTVIVMLAIAFAYTQLADPVYQVKATLLVNTPKDADKPAANQSVLDKIDLPKSTDAVENEIAKLKSAKLINQVIADLQLDVRYEKKDGLLYKELYATRPFRVLIVKRNAEADPKTKVFIQIKDHNSFVLKTDGVDKLQSFNDVLHTEWGTWKVIPASDVSSFVGKPVRVSLLDADKLTEYYQKNIDAALEDKLATAVNLSFNTNDKQKGKDIINQLIKVYHDDEIADKNKETQNTINFIDQRLASLTGELSGVEKSISDFKSSNRLTDITSDAKFELEKLQNNDSRLSEINVQLSVIDGIESFVNSPHTGDKAPAVIGINDPALVSSVEKLAQLQLQHDQLAATTPETNPDFEEINAQIRTTKAAIKDNVKNIKASLLNAQSKLRSQSSSSESSIASLPGQEQKFISIKRQQSIKENLYIYLLQKREEVSMSYATTVSNYKVLDAAHSLPSKWPNKKIIYLAAFLLGIMLPAGGIYLAQQFKGLILDPAEIENATEMPVFVEVAAAPAAGLARGGLVVEQLRNLRTRLFDLHSAGKKSNVTLITSSISGEGKSFIAGNIGNILANTGKKTVILELDLRRSAIKDIFKLSKKQVGISDYLRGNAELTKIIQPSGVNESLDIISSGSAVSNPTELLENGRLSELIAELEHSYTNIIIDSPPVHLVADAYVIARVSDVTLYVARQGVTPKSELTFIKTLLKENKLPNMQIVFNGVNVKKFGFGYEYDNSYYQTTSLPGELSA